MLILSWNYGGPPKPAEEARWHNTGITTSQTTDCKQLTADTTMCTLPMLINHSVITQIHCLILIYQQFRSWYWHPPGQFLCQMMVFQVPLKPLDNDCLPGWTQAGENGKNKWVKQYTMIITARHRWKFGNKNWRYGHQNNHFRLNANFHWLFFIFFQGTSQFQGYFRDVFRGINHFRSFSGFSGVSGVTGHPVYQAKKNDWFLYEMQRWTEMG